MGIVIAPTSWRYWKDLIRVFWVFCGITALFITFQSVHCLSWYRSLSVTPLFSFHLQSVSGASPQSPTSSVFLLYPVALLPTWPRWLQGAVPGGIVTPGLARACFGPHPDTNRELENIFKARWRDNEIPWYYSQGTYTCDWLTLVIPSQGQRLGLGWKTQYPSIWAILADK